MPIDVNVNRTKRALQLFEKFEKNVAEAIERKWTDAKKAKENEKEEQEQEKYIKGRAESKWENNKECKNVN